MTRRGKCLLFFAIGYCGILSSASSWASRDSIPSNEKIRVVANVSRDSIQLRWAPVDYSTWQVGLAVGYSIDKYVIARNSVLLSEAEHVRMTDEPIVPWQEKEWETIVVQNSFAAIAAQAIFGEGFQAGIASNSGVSIANKVSENNQRFYFALYSADISLLVAQAQGLYFLDRSVKRDEKYLYKVRVITMADTLVGSVFVSGDQETNFLETPTSLQVECKNAVANLRWERPLLTNYAGYIVERSFDLKTFFPISDYPIVTLATRQYESNRYEYANDSLHSEKETYFRIIGQSIFGQRSLPSEVKSCKNSFEISMTSTISKGFSVDNKSIQIEWECQSNPDVKGFFVERATADHGPYKTLNALAPLPPAARTFVDLNPEISNYYRINVFGDGEKGTVSHSYFVTLVDSIPPSPPVDLSAQVDNFGQIKLKWKDNLERDIYGYRIYISNNRKEEMAQVTAAPVRSSHYDFNRSVRALNDSLFVGVVAIDNNQNQSKLSRIFALGLPDLIKPTAPIMLPPKIDSSGVLISWIRSSSVDVVGYELYRMPSSNNHWSRVSVVQASADSVCTFTDLTGPKGVSLLYTVVAIDDSGLESSRANPVMTKLLFNKTKPVVIWNGSRILGNNKILLRWDYKEPQVRLFRIYKSVSDGMFELIKTLSHDQTELIERYTPETKCSFRITAIFGDGTQSALSDILTFN